MRYGWKIVGFDNGQAFSLYDPAIKISTKVGETITMPKGIYLGTSEQFCLDYYSGMTDGEELLLKYSYSTEDLIRGNPEDSDGEIIVKKATLLEVSKVQKND